MQKYIISNEYSHRIALAAIEALGFDPVQEIVIRPHQRRRKLDQNALMWVGPLTDIANQAEIDGKKFSDKNWHRLFKKLYLPDENEMTPEELAIRVENPETYKKWDTLPDGSLECVGSTTELTITGFAEYLEQVYRDGAELGVRFTASPKQQTN